MAGHRAQHGRAKRSASRDDRMSRRLAGARTAEEQLAAAYDAFRMTAAHIPDADRRARVLRAAAQDLIRHTTEAAQMGDGHSG